MNFKRVFVSGQVKRRKVRENHYEGLDTVYDSLPKYTTFIIFKVGYVSSRT